MKMCVASPTLFPPGYPATRGLCISGKISLSFSVLFLSKKNVRAKNNVCFSIENRDRKKQDPLPPLYPLFSRTGSTPRLA